MPRAILLVDIINYLRAIVKKKHIETIRQDEEQKSMISLHLILSLIIHFIAYGNSPSDNNHNTRNIYGDNYYK